jgi:hypothetical protein
MVEGNEKMESNGFFEAAFEPAKANPTPFHIVKVNPRPSPKNGPFCGLCLHNRNSVNKPKERILNGFHLKNPALKMIFIGK